MIRFPLAALLSATSLALAAAPGAAQQDAAPASRPELAIGQPAPDFTLVGATRYGVLRDSVRLSSLRGQTVVLAFFYRARSKG